MDYFEYEKEPFFIIVFMRFEPIACFWPTVGAVKTGLYREI
jgi:hypothetical protein